MRPAFVHIGWVEESARRGLAIRFVFNLGAVSLRLAAVERNAVDEVGVISAIRVFALDFEQHKLQYFLLKSRVCVGMLNQQPEVFRTGFAHLLKAGETDLFHYGF
ncbi:MAG TPA: hypothetical protein VF629_02715 [Hymenobacter sp.]